MTDPPSPEPTPRRRVEPTNHDVPAEAYNINYWGCDHFNAGIYRRASSLAAEAAAANHSGGGDGGDDGDDLLSAAGLAAAAGDDDDRYHCAKAAYFEVGLSL